MKKISILLFICFLMYDAGAQSAAGSALIYSRDSLLHAKDSMYKVMLKADSAKINKDFAEKAKWEKLEAESIYPALKGSKNSGVVPVKNPSEIPDPTMEYKILFELVSNNPDSIVKDINAGLDEIARVINLHAASGIPLKKIKPVIIVHGGALNAIKNNEAYQKKYKLDNPNIKLINDMKNIGAKFIACGQAMEFFDVKSDDLLPFVKISLTAQTVITSYQLKGYVLHQLW